MKPPVGAMAPTRFPGDGDTLPPPSPSRHTGEEQSLKEYYHAA